MMEDIRVFGSITLNHMAGGIDPLSVQLAGEMGARVVFMPTWCSKNDMDKGAHYIDRMRPFVTTIDKAREHLPGLTVLDTSGRLTVEAKEIVGPVSYTHLDVYKRQPWRW